MGKRSFLSVEWSEVRWRRMEDGGGETGLLLIPYVPDDWVYLVVMSLCGQVLKVSYGVVLSVE